MKNIKMVFVFFLFFLGLSSLEAQDQSGSVAIAGTIVPATDNMMSDFVACVEKLKATGASRKEASSDCKDVTKITSKTITRLANEAADATKASRPMVVMGGYGYGYGYDNYGYRGYSRPVVVRQPPPVRSAPHRLAPPPRPAPPSRPAPVR